MAAITALTCGMAYGVGSAIAGVFAALSVLHVYWALGGTAGLAAAIPARPSSGDDGANNGKPVPAFHPTIPMTLLVAAALATVSALVSLRAGVFAPATTHWSLQWSLAAVALILALRAVGDRNLVGLFKQVKGTRFAMLDSWLYSPLCALLALGILSLTMVPN
jgi:hypothetical protein